MLYAGEKISDCSETLEEFSVALGEPSVGVGIVSGYQVVGSV